MKKFTKLMTAAVAAFALLFAVSANAQGIKPGGWGFSIGIEPGIPTGNASDISSFEIGGTARLEYKASANFAVIATIGYYDFLGKSDPNVPGVKYTSLGMVPAKVGAKYYVAPMFYIDGEVGLGFDTNYESHTKLLFSPGVGYAGQAFDIGLRYENYSGNNNSFGLVGLRVAYNIGL